MQATIAKLRELSQQAQTEESRRALAESEEYQKLLSDYQKLATDQRRLAPEPTQSGDFVWLFRRR